MRNTKGNVNEDVQLAGQQQNKDKDNMGPPLNRVSYAVTKGIEKLNVLDTFSARGFEAFSIKILSALQVFMPSSKVQRREVLSSQGRPNHDYLKLDLEVHETGWHPVVLKKVDDAMVSLFRHLRSHGKDAGGPVPLMVRKRARRTKGIDFPHRLWNHHLQSS